MGTTVLRRTDSPARDHCSARFGKLVPGLHLELLLSRPQEDGRVFRVRPETAAGQLVTGKETILLKTRERGSDHVGIHVALVIGRSAPQAVKGPDHMAVGPRDEYDPWRSGGKPSHILAIYCQYRICLCDGSNHGFRVLQEDEQHAQ